MKEKTIPELLATAKPAFEKFINYCYPKEQNRPYEVNVNTGLCFVMATFLYYARKHYNPTADNIEIVISPFHVWVSENDKHYDVANPDGKVMEEMRVPEHPAFNHSFLQERFYNGYEALPETLKGYYLNCPYVAWLARDLLIKEGVPYPHWLDKFCDPRNAKYRNRRRDVYRIRNYFYKLKGQ